MNDVGVEPGDSPPELTDVAGQQRKGSRPELGWPNGFLSKVAQARVERHDLDCDAYCSQLFDERTVLAEYHRRVDMAREFG
jgi:hypothetical protein